MTSPSEIAERRDKMHENHESHRPLSKGSGKVGMAGEVAFGMWSGHCPDFENKPEGDGGIDFTVNLKFTVDVKTARKPLNLIHEKGKPFADIYVLAGYDEKTGDATLIGWTWGKTLAKQPVATFKHDVLNHYLDADELDTMESLAERLHR